MKLVIFSDLTNFPSTVHALSRWALDVLDGGALR